MYVIYKKDVEGCAFERHVFNYGDEFLIQKQILVPVWHGVCTKSQVQKKIKELRKEFKEFRYVYKALKPTTLK